MMPRTKIIHVLSTVISFYAIIVTLGVDAEAYKIQETLVEFPANESETRHFYLSEEMLGLAAIDIKISGVFIENKSAVGDGDNRAYSVSGDEKKYSELK
ncbi:hypothetical protein KQX54_005419 [Cotesia glomerata]|uniref:Uncharacterized protein n=1 Tax=Cotesia glomerata TaxID=32391 RepID=A0AAV7IL52_COTGL|nr:hypothetical protein KQX54_005419 [Cotesia glomerata]